MIIEYEKLPKEHVSACPVCGYENGTTIAHQDRYGVKAKFQYCDACDFIFAEDVLTPEAADTFYATMYRPLTKQYRGETNIQANQCMYGAALTTFLKTRVGEVTSILDLGGSTGIVSSMVADELDAEFTVVDPNPEELAKAKESGARTIKSQIEDCELEEQFDVVLLCRTIDHCARPLQVMRKAKSWMAPGAYLYYDFSDWLLVARSEGYTNAFHVDHPSNFTAAPAEKLISAVGLQPVGGFIPPSSSCFGYLCSPGLGLGRAMPGALMNDIRYLQAQERRASYASS